MTGHVLCYCLLVALLVRTVWSIQCYECNSKQTPDCSDPFVTNTSAVSPLLVDCVFRSRSILEIILSETTALGQSQGIQALPQGPVVFPSELLTCQKIDLMILGERVTGRGCSGSLTDVVPPCDVIKHLATSDLTVDSCSVCESDGCNFAVRSAAHSLLVLVVVVCLRLT